MNLNIKSINSEKISIIKDLWQKLNEIHLNDSKYFKDHFATFTFEKRCEILKNIDPKNIKIDVLLHTVMNLYLNFIKNSVFIREKQFLK